jgi:hypothetical protein
MSQRAPRRSHKCSRVVCAKRLATHNPLVVVPPSGEFPNRIPCSIRIACPVCEGRADDGPLQRLEAIFGGIIGVLLTVVPAKEMCAADMEQAVGSPHDIRFTQR